MLCDYMDYMIVLEFLCDDHVNSMMLLYDNAFTIGLCPYPY